VLKTLRQIAQYLSYSIATERLKQHWLKDHNS
jgi:hypothetical protein